MPTNKENILNLIKRVGIIRARDLDAHKISRRALYRLEVKGLIRRISRGLYELPESDPSEHIDLIEVCKKIPQGVICLISALNFHNMTTQMPYETWVAIDVKAYKPKLDRQNMRIVRFSGKALTFGVECHNIHGTEVRVTSPAKTVADCFKYRNKIGVDIATEALKEFIHNRKGKRDDLWLAAEVCRVTNVIRPYIEAIS